jgi:hypothetical protein
MHSMMIRRLAFVGIVGAATWSCARSAATSTPAPTTTTAAAPAAPGGGTGARRPRPSRDSVARARAFYVAQVLQSIAGHENEPAERVFKNVQVLKGITAAQLVHKMDEEYGVALSFSCTNCHRLNVPTTWASDTANDKKRARAMQLMVNDINHSYLPKLYPKDTPEVNCVSCHRGYNEPPKNTLLPGPGQPGAPTPPL